MAKTITKSDEYSQAVYLNLNFDATAAAAGNIQEIPTAYSTKDKVAVLIRAWEIVPASGYTFQGMMALGDEFKAGICFLPDLPAHLAIYPNAPGYIDMIDFYTDGVNATLRSEFLYKDLTFLKGGGKLVHPTALHAYASSGLSVWAGAASFVMAIYYDIIPISGELYNELWESQIILAQIG